jgi:arylsulfatase A-like enzyme
MLRTTLLLLALTVAATPAAGAERPNIVLIYADDLGFGDVSCNGARAGLTPNVDRLASVGRNFTDAHSTSATCTPSRYALITGEYPWRKRGTGVLPGDARLIIEPGRTTLAGVLKATGYWTGVVGKWHLGLGGESLDWNGEIRPGPLEVGFDESFIMAATGDRVPCVYVRGHRVVGLDPADPLEVRYDRPFPGEPTARADPGLVRLPSSQGHDMAILDGLGRIGYMKGGRSALWKDEQMADTFTREAVAFIRRNRSVPFFLYFATHDIHVPRVPHPRFAGRSGMGPRGDAIIELDWSVGEILRALDEVGAAGNTLVLLTSRGAGDRSPAGPSHDCAWTRTEAPGALFSGPSPLHQSGNIRWSHGAWKRMIAHRNAPRRAQNRRKRIDMGPIRPGRGQPGGFRTRGGPGQIGQGIEGGSLIVQAQVGVDAQGQRRRAVPGQ